MYKSESVKQLHQILPKLNKSDPFKKEEISETDISSIEEQIVVEEEDNSMASESGKMSNHNRRYDMSVTIEKEESSPKSSTKHSSKHSPKHSPKLSPKSSRHKLNFSTDSGEGSTPQACAGTQTNLERSYNYPFHNMSPPLRGFYGHPFGATTDMPYTGGLVPATSFHNPLANFPSLYSLTMINRPMSMPMLNTSPLCVSSSLQESPLIQSLPTLFDRHKPQSASLPDMVEHQMSQPKVVSAVSGHGITAPASRATGEATLASITVSGATEGFESVQSFASTRDSGLGSMQSLSVPTYQNHLSYQKSITNTSLLPDRYLSSVTSRLQASGVSGIGLDQNQHVMRLLTEIDDQRSETRKLKMQLTERHNEIEALRMSLKLLDVEKKADSSEAQKAASMVQEVYGAQKKRDDASSARIKIANEERVDVIARLQQLEAKLDAPSTSPLFDQSNEEDLHLDEDHLDESEDLYLLLSNLDSPSLGDNEVLALVRKVETLRQRQREIINEEMQIVIEQRDGALAKCQKLEEELQRCQRDSDADGGVEKTLKTKLAIIQQERDLAIAKSKQLDDEIQTIRIYYSLHKSLSCENSFKQSANHAMSGPMRQAELKGGHIERELECVQKENKRLITELCNANIDKKQLQQALESVTIDKERLQRLAAVLKRKVENLTSDQFEEDQQ